MRDRSMNISPGQSQRYWQKVRSSSGENSYFYIEVIDRSGREEVGLLDGVDVNQMINLISNLASHLGCSFQRVKPSKASIEIGVEFGLENGQLVAFIARGSGKATMKIELEWDRTSPPFAPD